MIYNRDEAKPQDYNNIAQNGRYYNIGADFHVFSQNAPSSRIIIS